MSATLCRTGVLHHCNRILVCQGGKFDELKEFNQVHNEKKHTNFLQCLEFFTNVEQNVKKLNSCRTDFLHYCNRFLIGLNLNFDTINFIWNFFSNVKQPLKKVDADNHTNHHILKGNKQRNRKYKSNWTIYQSISTRAYFKLQPYKTNSSNI